jgi:hypothetical protein
MKPEPYVIIESSWAIPLRCLTGMDEIVPIESKYENDVGYIYSLAKRQIPTMQFLSKDYVAGMIAADKLK